MLLRWVLINLKIPSCRYRSVFGPYSNLGFVKSEDFARREINSGLE